jgi:penicillin-binding protein 1A
LTANKAAEPTKAKKPEPSNTSTASEQVQQLFNPH